MIYENGKEYILESFYLPTLGDRSYLFLTYPRYDVQYESFYNMDLVDSSEHYTTWYIKNGNVTFAEDAFPIRSDEKEIYYSIGKERYNEIYPEEQIDDFLRENLTVQEDLWKAYVEEMLQG